ncbi:hypothetical protein HK096_006866, partial [Nowakowskiella sp. JEL0078]
MKHFCKSVKDNSINVDELFSSTVAPVEVSHKQKKTVELPPPKSSSVINSDSDGEILNSAEILAIQDIP